ncbi:MAG: hypothetical protein ACK549_11900 [Cyanobacteriota bacterium]
MRGGGGHGWRRLAPLLAAAALGWGAALAVAALLAAVLAPISVDQPIYGRELVGWGMRWGAVLAVALASGAMLGSSPQLPSAASGWWWAPRHWGWLASACSQRPWEFWRCACSFGARPGSCRADRARPPAWRP